jgi:HEAT repeat protein
MRMNLDTNTKVRFSAAKALGNLGKQADSAVPALLKSLEDRQQSVRRATSEALGKIAPERATKPE